MMAGAMAMSLAGCGSQETPASAETTGTVQASSEQPQATTEAAETTTDEDMTLDQIVRYAKIRGYYLGEDFTVQGSPMAMDDDDMEITVEYKSAKTDLADVDGLETRMTKEEMALDILDRLGKYYTIYYNFISNNTSSWNFNHSTNFIFKRFITTSNNLISRLTYYFLNIRKFISCTN